MFWNIQSSLTQQSPQKRQQEIISHLLKIRGLTKKSDIETFLNPPLPLDLSLKQVALSSSTIKKAIDRIQHAISQKQQIVIYGDYDADGITATAILWETLHSLGAKTIPFIPLRERHGYGLSVLGVQDLIEDYHPELIITVDNGIVAHEAAVFIKQQSIDLIITDHHQRSAKLPLAHSIIHSDQISGAGVAWFLAREIVISRQDQKRSKQSALSTLDLLTIGTIADMMPMVGVNRSIAKHGLVALTQSARPGIQALKQVSGLEPEQELSAYHVGFNLGPRINAMGRLEHGLDALRLLCTKNQSAAAKLAKHLDDTNKTRQDLTFEMLEIADQIYQKHYSDQKIIVIDHPDFHEGIIGLIAGRLTDKYSKPSIIISRGEQTSKASARSPFGINIIEIIRSHQELLLGAGGHPGAAGLSLETANINLFRDQITQSAQAIDDKLLQPALNIDCQINLSDANLELYEQIQQFMPFGIANPKPTFSAQAKILDIRTIGRDNNHLKLKLNSSDLEKPIDALFWQKANDFTHLNLGDDIQVAFNLDKNEWKQIVNPQLIVKDIC